MTPLQLRPDLHARFLDVVARAIVRTDREHEEHLARIRARRVAPAPARVTHPHRGGRRRRA